MPTETFSSPESYRKYRAYVHIHHIPTHSKRVVVKGHGSHLVKHGKKTRKHVAARKHGPSK